ncbi:MAG: transglycosylase domain-containing protein [Acidimicrobiales bacterium]
MELWPPFEYEPVEPAVPDTRRAIWRWVAGVARAVLWAVGMVLRWVATVTLGGALVTTAIVVLTLTIGILAPRVATTAPAPQLTFPPLATRSVVYASDGTALAVLHSEEDRVLVPIDQMPGHVTQAVLDAEDERFFEHSGLDARAIVRAATRNLEAARVVEGGSTITQQLVKIEFLTSTKDLDRKLKEAALALRLERQLTKTEILDRYLNRVYFGNGAYGIQAAAQHYYRENVQALTLPQAVLLAGLIREPAGADPFTNPDEARGRRDSLADRMYVLGHITAEQAAEVKADPLPTRPPHDPPRSSDYFAEHVKQQLLQADWLGDTPEARVDRLFEGGLSIYTTLEPRAQDLAQASIDSIVPSDPRGFTASLVSVEPATGAVRALVGGPNFQDTKFNLATDGGRQVGSAFKVFTLTAALESGVLPVDTISGAQPCPIDNAGGGAPVWSPSNVEGQAAGTLTVAEATIRSVNCAYARLIKLVGPQKVVDVAHRMGITSALGAHLSLTLGSEPVTPLQMASAYATLANDGVQRAPYFVERVVGPDGAELYRHMDEPEQAISAEHARIVTDVLTQVVASGTATAAAVPDRPVAGKTGSTDENADAWFVGFTPQLATAVWMGAPEARVSMYNVGRFPRVYGGTYPAMVFGAYMRSVLGEQPSLPFPVPPPPTRDSIALA